MSPNVGVDTSGQAQELLTHMQNAMNYGDLQNKELSAASGLIGPGGAWGGPYAQSWQSNTQDKISRNTQFNAETAQARLDAQRTMSNISVAGGGSTV
jgi:hypothetical protein